MARYKPPGPGLFTRVEIGRSFGWRPYGGNNRRWKKFLRMARIDHVPPYNIAETKRILMAYYEDEGHLAAKRIERGEAPYDMPATSGEEPDPPT